ncbi:MAG: hypothetical protein PWP12_1023 [Bacillota bacterium]|nr:hypothetical protein [Bacillota bacterium]MDK2883387.1 hypothetical protein [Bacillota bacterium]MDK2960839.1 hypothetical protein [Bacillota bacterium]
METTLSEYLETLAGRLSPYFDVFRNEEVAGRRLDLVGRFKMRSEKYFFVKSLTLFAYENREIVLVEGDKEINRSKAEEFAGYLKDLIPLLIKPSEEHMSTMLTGVLVAEEGVTPEAQVWIGRFRHSQNFKWLLHGWCDVRLLAVDLASGQVYSNKAGRAVKEAYRVLKEKGGKEAAGPR